MTEQLSERVDVPEFGPGMYVNVRNLPAYERELLASWGVQGKGYQVIAIVAALASYDDEGALVFGEDRADAIKRAADFYEDGRLWKAFWRVCRKAMELTARLEPDSRLPDLSKDWD